MTKAVVHVNALALATLFFAAGDLRAQSTVAHHEDATAPARGVLRLRVTALWSRTDTRFAGDSVEALGAPFTSDALGPARFQPLAPIQSLVETASATPFTLSLGRSRLDAEAREERVPLMLELGLTDRLSLSVMMPVIRKRMAALFRLDTAGGFSANVGPNLHRTSTTASTANELVQTEFASAITSLQNLLNTCAGNPGAPGCAAVNGREAQAQALIQSSSAFAAAVASLYGSAGTGGSAFVPLTGSTAQLAIQQRIADFNTSYRDFLSAGSDVVSALPRGAAGIAGAAQFQRYLNEDLGLDSLNFQERIGVGDVEVGLKLLAIDRRPTETRPLGLQLAVASGVRLPTGSRLSTSNLADMRLGGGSYVVDSRLIADMRFGRFGLLSTGHFAMSVADRDTIGVDLRASRWTEVHLAPRWHLSEPLALHAAYSFRSTDREGGDQLIGAGLSFSTHRGLGRVNAPLEMRFTHLEALTGDPGRPKFFREQLELRVYHRLLN